MKPRRIIYSILLFYYVLNNVYSFEKNQCYNLAPKSQTNSLISITTKAGFSYTATDKSNFRFHCNGSLVNGVLNLDMKTVDRKTNERSKFLKGKEQLTNILNFFGNQIKEIKGRWDFGDNLKKVNELVYSNPSIPLTEAVFRTWLGRTLKDHGYIFINPNTIFVEKGKGKFAYVSVHFFKNNNNQNSFIKSNFTNSLKSS